MNIAVDIGNTRTKLGVFHQDRLIEHFTWESWRVEDFIMLATNHKAQNIILCSVAGGVSPARELLSGTGFYCMELDARTPLPFKNQYRTPETLGKDRLAAIGGAYQLYEGVSCLVIDAGTCITYDLLTAEGEYLGGNIAPGLRMRLAAMHRLTQRLPEVTPGETESWIGYSTESAMRNGGQWGAILEIEGYIGRCRAEFGRINVILTGGDAIFLAKKLKSKIFVNPHLVLIGLNKILNYNVDRLE